MTANTLIVTQVGLDAAVTSASPGGIALVLSTFKVGSAFGYTPTTADTALHGSVLYSDNITSFSTASDGSLIVNCTMSVEAGPFDFGELGIYTSTGALFALLALPATMHKYTSLGSTVASTFSFRCYLRLGQVGGIIEIDTGGGGGGGGGTSNFVYTLMSGQPPALWGTNDGGTNSFVWNPSNFNVATAVSAKGIVSTTAVTYAGSGHTWYNADGTTLVAELDTSGNFSANNLGTISDERHKKNIEELSDEECLDVALGLHGITYEMLSSEDGQRYPGIRAQELLPLFAEGVNTKNPDRFTVLYAQTMGAIFPGALRAVYDKHNKELRELRNDFRYLTEKFHELGRQVAQGPLRFGGSQ